MTTVIFREIRLLGVWLLLLAAAWGSIFAVKAIETTFFPVVKNVEITEAVPVEGGTNVYLTFTKVRSCDFKKVLWYDQNDNILDVVFNDNRGTRPPSNNEVGPWFVSATELVGTRLYVQHTCHLGWSQWTQMYPDG